MENRNSVDRSSSEIVGGPPIGSGPPINGGAEGQPNLEPSVDAAIDGVLKSDVS